MEEILGWNYWTGKVGKRNWEEWAADNKRKGPNLVGPNKVER